MKREAVATLCTAILVLCSFSGIQALTAGGTFAIAIQKLNSNGTVSDYSTTSTTADSNGKLVFSFSSVPTNSDCNFLVITIRDSQGNVQRKGFVPAPPTGSTNLLGINALSTAQTNAVLAAAQVIARTILSHFHRSCYRNDGGHGNDRCELCHAVPFVVHSVARGLLLFRRERSTAHLFRRPRSSLTSNSQRPSRFLPCAFITNHWPPLNLISYCMITRDDLSYHAQIKPGAIIRFYRPYYLKNFVYKIDCWSYNNRRGWGHSYG